jgi:hypothetical protein
MILIQLNLLILIIDFVKVNKYVESRNSCWCGIRKNYCCEENEDIKIPGGGENETGSEDLIPLIDKHLL